MTVVYEWDVETHVYYNDNDEIDSMDVLDHQFCDSFKEALHVAYKPADKNPDGVTSHHIVLVRDDEEKRSWAYIVDGQLPEFFMDADGKNCTRVPQKFHQEVTRAK